MLSRISSLKCFAVNVSKFITTKKTTPVSNLLLHTATADCRNRKNRRNRNNIMGIPPQPKVAVMIFGCGIEDGSEPCEVVSLEIHLDGHNILVDYYTADISVGVFNHYSRSNDPFNNRNCMRESNRLLINNNVKDIMDLRPDDYHGIIISGGRGIFKMSSDYNQRCASVLKEFRRTKKPIGTISCGAFPVAHIFQGLLFTMGIQGHSYYNNEIQTLVGLGMKHQNAPPGSVVHCPEHNVFSTPGYSYSTVAPVIPKAPDFMMPPSMNDAFEGIGQLVVGFSKQLYP